MPLTDLINQAEKRIRPYLVTTPLLTSDRLNQKLPFDLYVKADCLQRTGSFKFRGACNAVFSLGPDVPAVIAYSSGNHAQAVALAARLSGRRATIIMPEDAPRAKIKGTHAYGAETVLYNRYTQSREEIGTELAAKFQAELIRPYDDMRVIAGQGTAGLEIAEQARRAGFIPDIFISCCGGGGLMAGSASALAAAFPATVFHTAEPAGFDDTARSLAAGCPVANDPAARSVCDAIVTPEPGTLTFPIIRALGASGLVVSDDAALGAVRAAWDYLKITLEPGGAVALAAALAPEFIDRQSGAGQRARVVVMGSGGNCDTDIFMRALDLPALV